MAKKRKIRRDGKGEFILETYLIQGKMKKRKLYVIDGIPADEFYERNADPITLLQDGNYEMLNVISFSPLLSSTIESPRAEMKPRSR